MFSNISFIYSAHIPSEKTLYMVMERGESDLHHVLQSYKSIIPCYTLITYFHQMLLCVKYIHQNGIIHSDLKPANFLIVNGRLKLIDFGIASSIATDATSIIKFSQAGTFNYISPEALIDTSSGNSPSRNQPKIKVKMNLYFFFFRKFIFVSVDIHQIRCLVAGMYFVSVIVQAHSVRAY